jgi:hypothetical protein
MMIIWGIAGGLFSLVILIANGGPGGLASAVEGASSILGPIVVGITFLNFLLAVPLVLSGLGLLQLKGWARSLSIVVCALEIISMPVGTLLGIYGLWVLTSLEVEPLFENRGN